MKWRYKYIALAVMAMLVSAGCSSEYTGFHSTFTPAPMFIKLPEDDSEYGQGFRDGCNTALGITGSGFVRSAHGFHYDVNRGIESREYYRGYRTGTVACVYHIDPSIL